VAFIFRSSSGTLWNCSLPLAFSASWLYTIFINTVVCMPIYLNLKWEGWYGCIFCNHARRCNFHKSNWTAKFSCKYYHSQRTRRMGTKLTTSSHGQWYNSESGHSLNLNELLIFFSVERTFTATCPHTYLTLKSSNAHRKARYEGPSSRQQYYVFV